ncbi:hypothetical protein F5887DRAFT_1072391 [Amanita rubescens]|nr:hypothetical protein F5887DRAFT_1072391 [Amanita rubescens]
MPLPSRVVSTLCPKRLRPSDLIDISGLVWPAIKLPSRSTPLRGLKHNNQVPFPPNTRGFLYYHTPPKAPPFVGEIRFRCANSLEDFPNGKDLLSSDKFNPWSIPLSVLANQASYLYFRGQLMLDDLVSQTTLDTWVTKRALHKSYGIGSRRPILYYFRQPFFLRFDTNRLAFYTATKDQLGFCRIYSPIRDCPTRARVCPYGGSGVVQLEVNVGPQRPEKEVMGLRVLKIVEPVKDLIKDYDGHVQRPFEGALFLQSRCTPESTLMNGAATLPRNFEDLP